MQRTQEELEILEKAKNLKPTNDWIFKKIYGRKGSEKITEKFIKAYLGLDVKIKKIYEEKNLEIDVYNEKAGKLDILVETEDGSQIDLEMQVGNYEFIEERLARYACKLFANGLEKGELYDKTRRTIVVMFTTGELPMLRQYPEHTFTWNIREKNHAELILTENFEIDIISLGKIRKLTKKGEIDEKEKYALWTKFLLNPKEMKVDELEENEEIKEANEEYEKVVTDLGEINRAIRREMFLSDIASIKHEGEKQGFEKGMKKGVQQGKADGIKQGIKEGIEKGEKEAKIEIAKKMLDKNKSVEEIIELTGLTKEEIEKLK